MVDFIHPLRIGVVSLKHDGKVVVNVDAVVSSGTDLVRLKQRSAPAAAALEDVCVAGQHAYRTLSCVPHHSISPPRVRTAAAVLHERHVRRAMNRQAFDRTRRRVCKQHGVADAGHDGDNLTLVNRSVAAKADWELVRATSQVFDFPLPLAAVPVVVREFDPAELDVGAGIPTDALGDWRLSESCV